MNVGEKDARRIGTAAGIVHDALARDALTCDPHRLALCKNSGPQPAALAGGRATTVAPFGVVRWRTGFCILKD